MCVIMLYCFVSCCVIIVFFWFYSVIEIIGIVCVMFLVFKIVIGNFDKLFKKFCIKVCLCFWIVVKLILFNFLIELFKFRIFKLFNVLVLNLFGKKEGWLKELEWLLVLFVISGLIVLVFCLLKVNLLIFVNLYKFLCLVKVNILMVIWVIFIGRKFVVWVVFKMVNNFFCWVYWKYFLMGKMVFKILDVCVIIKVFVFVC